MTDYNNSAYTDMKKDDPVTVRFMSHYKGSHFRTIRKDGMFIKMLNSTECLVQIKGNKNPSRVLERRTWKRNNEFKN